MISKVPIQLEMVRYPIVIVRWQGENTDQQVLAYLAQMTPLVRRPERKVFIYDALTAQIPGPKQRRMQGDWLTSNQDALERWGAGTAFVLDSALMRGALTAVLWLAPVPHGHFVGSTVDEALLWAGERLRQAAQAKAADF